MTVDQIAENAVDLLAQLLAGVLTGTAKQAADELFDLASSRMARKREPGLITALQDSPGDLQTKSKLRQKIAQEMSGDGDFRQQVVILLDRSAQSTTASIRQTAGRDNFGAGRDLSVDQSKRNTKINFGGVVVTIVAVAALIFGGKFVIEKIQESTGSTLTGDSTCTEFLKADSATQVAVMKELYLNAKQPERAGDPFILQNATYSCGQAPNMKLSRLASR
jgi:hypothetical protein